MSDPHTESAGAEEAITGSTSILGPYGLGGDHAGARRVRRSFRFLVAACLGFTLMLWFAENYLRFSTLESQYRMALTLPGPSARAVMRNVVRRESQRGGNLTPKYVELLAGVEERDVMLERYAEAYELNPSDPFLIVKYGCRLFLDLQYREARERFREAGVQAPGNALPRYLEAAALAASVHAADPAFQDEALNEAMTLVARINSSGDPVVFPEPLWHASLPRGGYWYAEQRRALVEQCCAPLYRLRRILVDRARAQIDAGHVGNWQAWLDHLYVLGARLARATGPDESGEGQPATTVQMLAGLQMQMDALGQQERIARLDGKAPDAATIERGIRIEEALEEIREFESTRNELIEGDRRMAALPLVQFVNGFALLLAAYIVFILANRWFTRNRAAWAIPHPRSAVLFAWVFFGLWLVQLCVLSGLHASGPPYLLGPVPPKVISMAAMALAILFAALFPVFILPRPRHLLSETRDQAEADSDQTPAMPGRAELRRARRAACITMTRRYLGVLLGALLCAICLWSILFRLAVGSYPWQLALTVTGLSEEEHALVREMGKAAAALVRNGGGL